VRDQDTKPGRPTFDEPIGIVPRGLEPIQHLGRGGMGSVTLARDLDLGRLVAIKTLSPKLAGEPGRAELFRTEAAMLARVRSAWVVAVHAFGVKDGLPYFVMEHVDGASLRALLDEHFGRGARLPLARSLGILRQVAQGLGELHQHGVVHRDVKPENVVVERGTGRPVIVDLGLGATANVDDGMRQVGTLHYMAPEVLSAGRELTASPTQDVYAYGCLLFEVLTGRPLFDLRKPELIARAHLEAAVPKLSSREPSLAPLDALLASLCAKDPRERPKDGHAVARMLMEAAHGMREEHTMHSLGEQSVAGIEGGAIRILVGEEDDPVRRFLARSAKVALYGTRTEVVTARDGIEAQAAFGRVAPHLAILDHGLQGTNGLVVIEQLRARVEGDRTRVIVVSGDLDEDTRRHYDALRADVVLRKPVAFDQLVQAVASLASTAGWVVDEG
jgi:CheY-like chemotaxis protein